MVLLPFLRPLPGRQFVIQLPFLLLQLLLPILDLHLLFLFELHLLLELNSQHLLVLHQWLVSLSELHDLLLVLDHLSLHDHLLLLHLLQLILRLLQLSSQFSGTVGLPRKEMVGFD